MYNTNIFVAPAKILIILIQVRYVFSKQFLFIFEQTTITSDFTKKILLYIKKNADEMKETI